MSLQFILDRRWRERDLSIDKITEGEIGVSGFEKLTFHFPIILNINIQM